MSDPRFARLKTDPRFRRPKKQNFKVVLDDRFKSVLDTGKKSKKAPRVDKFGRKLADDHGQDNLRRFYRLEHEDTEEPETAPDYARGEVLLESSDEDEDHEGLTEGDESDTADVVTLGGQDTEWHSKEEGSEIDLDESQFADLDTQAAAYSKDTANADGTNGDDTTVPTRRLAVVNLDWDHIRAVHLFKIFESIVSVPAGASSSRGAVTSVTRGKVLSVRIYPSQFGKERMEREEREGPPVELFKKKASRREEINEKTIYETGDADEYDDDALRKYQLERLRYYYAVVECDSAQVASHIYSELQGTELERSANVFDMSFIPDEMEFENDFRDEAIAVDPSAPYRALDFTTDALRHSKVKLTWDQEDPERNRITRRALTKKEVEEGDFHAYIASSSESESDSATKPNRNLDRDKLRALLLSGGGGDLPEGWGSTRAAEDGHDDVDMEVTFMPALSEKTTEEETTLEKYQRKMREKRKKRKEEWKTKIADEDGPSTKVRDAKDDFFGEDGEDAGEAGEEPSSRNNRKSTDKALEEARRPSTQEELSLLVAADSLEDTGKHFDLKAVLKAEKGRKGRKGKRAQRDRSEDGANELQENFAIDVKDERFQALHEDYNFAIDPSNPHFKKTKSMSALLDERSKRQQQKRSGTSNTPQLEIHDSSSKQSLRSLVESVKRKNTSHRESAGKRRKT